MATFKTIPATRIVTSRSVEGRNEAGAQVRFELIETEKNIYIQHLVDGVGISTTQFSGARRTDAPAAFDQVCLTELGTPTEAEPTEALATPPEPTEALAEPSVEVEVVVEAAPSVEVEPVVEAAPPAPTEALAEPVAEVAPTTRTRGANRPDSETPVWAQGDLAVVMVQGRTFRYDLRRGEETIESVVATRSWRTQRAALVAKAQTLLAAPAA